jgi:hypothetical protein
MLDGPQELRSNQSANNADDPRIRGIDRQR